MKFFCIHCGQKLGARTMYSGKQVRCPKCGREQQAPQKTETAPVPTPAPQPAAELKQTLQSKIDRSARTISQFMAEKQIEGAIDLNAADSPSSASKILAADQGRKYLLGDVVARGGMGAIIDAKDANLRRHVAMKVLRDRSKTNKEVILRFIQEAQITSQLEHPAIMPIHELGVDAAGNVFYTMKFVHGETLKDVLRGIHKGNTKTIETYPLSHLLTVFQKVCDAVAFAHSKHVIHRDLKPENIMIGDYGEVLVMDWGLAKVLTGKLAAQSASPDGRDPASLRSSASPASPSTVDSVGADQSEENLKTMDGTAMGTPGFMPPEQVLGEVGKMTERSDIYALGAILYNMLTLHPPVTGKNFGELLQKTTTGDIPHPTSYNRRTKAPGIRAAGSATHASGSPSNVTASPMSNLHTPVPPTNRDDAVPLPHLPDNNVPEALAAVAMKALALDPNDRYPSVSSLQREVENYQTGRQWCLVFEDEFSDPDVSGRWDIPAGQWTVEDGCLHVSGGPPQTLVLRKHLPGDVRLEFDCLKKQVASNLGCFLNAEPDYYRYGQRGGYQIAVGGAGNSCNWIYRGNNALVEEHRTSLDEPRWYHVAAQRIGSTLTVELDGKVVLQASDPSPLMGTAIGLWGWMEDTAYAHVKVYRLGVTSKADLLDVAEEQLQRGRTTTARDLLQVVLESGPDTRRRAMATRGLGRIEAFERSREHVGDYSSRLAQAWPNVPVSVQLDAAGLRLDIGSGDKPPEDTKGSTVGRLNVHSLEPIREMSLTTLRCPWCHIADLSPLHGKPLTLLFCQVNHVRDLSPLAGMPLRVFRCDGNEVESLDPVSGAPLEFLDCSVNRIADLPAFNNAAFEAFYCTHNRIRSLPPLGGQSLKVLELDYNQVSDLSPVRDMKRLRRLFAAHNNLTTLAPLRGSRIAELDVRHNNIGDLSPLAALPLSSLNCSHNAVESLEPLKGTGVSALTCAANPLTSLDPFVVNPPQTFLFDCDTLPTEELFRAASSWGQQERTMHLARHAEILIALREGRWDDVRVCAVEMNGRRYLHVPRFVTWEQAASLSEKLGGHLVVIRSPQENRFIAQLSSSDSPWIGMVGTKGDPLWITGETMSFKRLAKFHLGLELRAGFFIRGLAYWSVAPDPLERRSFVVEWDPR